ncbi:response regulator transcription factor LtdR [Faecalicatena orotica]|uniref:Stage 0 sporulation protein A homolog n=1 Tax=Faecalicatena orotica TaxID=1544 RepID=A0A2Y9BLY1_9FIRM|nr:LytTR family DNA-binding domain-containing protein [Faecalicatena orotica]PWJ23199.1 LytTR family two component transcriptional regulator [Faecalicatena orotica]SSA57936.1 two component transcriptional regulator, LytTR family [Faecalicatena orotica]
MARILILEDDGPSRKALVSMIGRIGAEIKADEAADLGEARNLLTGGGSYDLFLLDVNLDSKDSSDASGLTFAGEVRDIMKYELTPIVMLTSVASLEIEAYRRIHCYQYILKPYEEEEVQRIVKRVLTHARPAEKPFVIVKKDGINYKILCEDIIFCKAIPRGVCIYLKNEQMDVPYLSIRQLLEKLQGQDFVQCHRMFVVNKKYVKYYDLVNQMIQVEKYPDEIDIGVTYKAEVRRLLNE